jgi:WD40 repeat protein
MRDTLEEQLAARLRAVGDTVADDLPAPVDLEMQVARHRRRARTTRRWSGVAIAAAVVATVATVAVVHGTAGRGTVRIATSSTTASPPDALQPGTVMLSARGVNVISLDATGHQNATMVAALRGDIKYARATDDHRALWYLSLKKGLHACGDVVRADIATGHSSTIVTHAVAFDVSPNGKRLALYGSGDLADDRCAPVSTTQPGRVVVVDLTNNRSSAISVPELTSLRFSPDGSYLAAVSCGVPRCEAFDRIEVPDVLGAPLVVEPVSWSAYPDQSIRTASIEFGPGGLYMLKRLNPIPGRTIATERIDRLDPLGLQPVETLFSARGWDISQMMPTASGTYVVATLAQPKPPKWGLYLVQAGKLVPVRSLTDPGTLTPVRPLAAFGAGG